MKPLVDSESKVYTWEFLNITEERWKCYALELVFSPPSAATSPSLSPVPNKKSKSGMSSPNPLSATKKKNPLTYNNNNSTKNTWTLANNLNNNDNSTKRDTDCSNYILVRVQARALWAMDGSRNVFTVTNNGEMVDMRYFLVLFPLMMPI